MIRFRLFGIPVTVEPWFWVTMVLIGGGLHASSREDLLRVILFVMAGFISLLIHEMGHALTIRKFRLPTEVTLQAFGGFASYPGGRLTRMQSFLVTAAGPGVQILFGVIVWQLSNRMEYPSAAISYFVNILWIISLVWAFFNCLPIFPLDGGQMLASIMGPQRAKGVHLTGIICAGVIGLLAFSSGQLFVAIFMGLFAYQNYQIFRQIR
jgi:Zn-dependent protease